MVLPKRFEQTSDLPYDRHTYKVHTQSGSTHIFGDYMEVQALWFQQGKFLSHVEVLDVNNKGFKEKTNERKRRKN
jgi:hypothetical protein